MNKLLRSLSSPWRHGGIIAGILDPLLRVAAIIIWAVTIWLALHFLYDAVFIEIIWAKKFWWIGYSAIIIFTVSVLAYTAVWDRK
jgi:hypothetical protein